MSTRLRSVILTSLIAVVYIADQLLDLTFLRSETLGILVRSLVLSLLVFVGVFWVINFKIKPSRILPILVFPAIFVFAVTFFSELLLYRPITGFSELTLLNAGQILLWMLGVLLSGVAVWVVTYITILTANILNVSVTSNIPLGQAGRASQYVLTLVSSYLGYSILFSIGMPSVVRIGFVFAFTLFLAHVSFWTIQIGKRETMLSSFLIAVLMLFMVVILSVWPLSVGYISLMMSIVLYMTLGVGLEIREKINAFVWIEYAFLFVVIVAIALLFGQFGINGTLL